MEIRELYDEILNEHNLYPSHKEVLAGEFISLKGVNPSCGDEITLHLSIKDGVIENGYYTGQGCALSQAASDMMLDLVIGKNVDEAKELYGLFTDMIKGKQAAGEAEEKLGEAAALSSIARLPMRVKCAVLAWRTMKEIIEGMK